MAKGEVVESPRLPEKGPTEKGKRQFNNAAATALTRRIEIAQRDGAVNIAVRTSFLLELLRAAGVAMKDANFKSTEEV